MKRLFKSADNRIFSGVLGGVSEYIEIDPVVVRLLAILIMLVTGIFPFALVYLLAVFIIPEQPADYTVVDSD